MSLDDFENKPVTLKIYTEDMEEIYEKLENICLLLKALMAKHNELVDHLANGKENLKVEGDDKIL